MAGDPGYYTLGPERKRAPGKIRRVEEEDGEFGGILDNNVNDLRDVVELG
jgi:hypothetical protein